MSAADPQMAALLAEHDGWCPLCGGYVRAGQSRILPLEPASVPRPDLVQYDPCNRVWLFASASIARMHPRSWGHARCIRQHHRSYPTFEERSALADEWRAELRALKSKRDTDMRECERRTRGRRQPPRRRSRA